MKSTEFKSVLVFSCESCPVVGALLSYKNATFVFNTFTHFSIKYRDATTDEERAHVTTTFEINPERTEVVTAGLACLACSETLSYQYPDEPDENIVVLKPAAQ